MGKQTDTHITNVTNALQQLQTSITHVNTSKAAIDNSWNTMMAAYDKGGRTASAAHGSALKSAVTQYGVAATAAKNQAATATAALNSFSTFVTTKDRNTINPLAKKSLGKAKKFVQAQKPDRKSVV